MGLSLSDNPFAFFARCYTNEITHVSIHHPFAKEELLLNVTLSLKTNLGVFRLMTLLH